MDTPRLPHDPLLPHLPLALDGGAMAEHFARDPRLAADWRVERCAVERVKFRPRRNLAIAYRLELRHRRDARTLTQPVGTRWCSGGEALARWRKATAAALAPSPAGPAVTHDAALDLVAHWWPHDPKLGLPAAVLSDAAALRRRWLPEVARQLAAPSATLAGAELALVQLVPEHRVTARAVLTLADGTRAEVYAKADAEQRGPATQAAMQALWDSAARRGGDLRVPQPLGWQAGSALHWQRAVPGLALLDAAPAQVAAAAGGVGALLAALHDTPVALARRETAAAVRQRLAELVTTLSRVEPAWAPALDRLARRVGPQLPALFDAPPATLHGDLHPRNLLLAPDGRLALIDLDSLRRGPALLDLGAWAADGLYRALLSGQAVEPVLASLRATLQGHRAAGGAAVTEPALASATAWQLLAQRAWRCAVNLKPGRYALVPSLLALAERLATAGTVDAAAATSREAA